MTDTTPGENRDDDAAEPLLHIEALAPGGLPTGYARCDTGDGTFPGGLLAHNSGMATCQACIDWEEPESEDEAE